jgi:hypothetical protein
MYILLLVALKYITAATLPSQSAFLHSTNSPISPIPSPSETSDEFNLVQFRPISAPATLFLNPESQTVWNQGEKITVTLFQNVTAEPRSNSTPYFSLSLRLDLTPTSQKPDNIKTQFQTFVEYICIVCSLESQNSSSPLKSMALKDQLKPYQIWTSPVHNLSQSLPPSAAYFVQFDWLPIQKVLDGIKSASDGTLQSVKDGSEIDTSSVGIGWQSERFSIISSDNSPGD